MVRFVRFLFNIIKLRIVKFWSWFRSKSNVPEHKDRVLLIEAVQESAVLDEEMQEGGLSISDEQRQALIDYYARAKSGYVGMDIYGGCHDAEPSSFDPLFEEAARLVVNRKDARTSLLQRELSIGYNRAGRLIDQLDSTGIIRQKSESWEREVLIDETSLGVIISEIKRLTSLSDKSDELDFELQREVDDRVSYYKGLKEEQDRERERAEIERQKEAIKQEILTKKRKMQIRQIALKELEEEGFVEPSKKREPIPQEIQNVVWNRDGGRCVKCGSQENIEFDHIIPFSKGGSNSARNLQLLCQKCNRSKSNKIG